MFKDRLNVVFVPFLTPIYCLGAASEHRSAFNSGNFSRGSCEMFELKLVLSSILKLQRWWKGVLLLRLRSRSATIIQSHIRGWISRRRAAKERHHIVLIQVSVLTLYCLTLYQLHTVKRIHTTVRKSKGLLGLSSLLCSKIDACLSNLLE